MAASDGDAAPEAPPRDLAAALEPALHAACEGRLSHPNWFRTDWQRGGAATGFAQWRGADGATFDVVVKMPVHPRELRWLRRVGTLGDRHLPRLFESGEALGGYDLAWVVIERLEHGPLLVEWTPECVDPMAQAAVAFSHLAASHPVDPLPPEPDWRGQIAEARRKVKELRLDGAKIWNGALRETDRRLDELLETWAARTPLEWIHGDLHPGNAMTRGEARPPQEVCLIDFAEVRVGHWVEDAVYLERLHWVHPERIAGHQPVKAIAAARKGCGLDNGRDHQRLAAIRRLLMATTAPAFAKTEGSPIYLEVCLAKAEEAIRSLK